MTMAGALMVIDTDTWLRSMPPKRTFMSSSVSTATPSRPTSPRTRVVAIEAHQRRQIEGGAQPVCPLSSRNLKALIGLVGGAEPSELPHGPEPAAVHRGMHAAGERILAGKAEIGVRIEAAQAVRRVQSFDGHAADGGRRLLPQRAAAYSFSSVPRRFGR